MRLIHTKPLHKVIGQLLYDTGQAHIKAAAVPETTSALAGRLYLSSSGWLLLSVPNALVRGAFDALSEPGVTLPYNSDDRLNAHITVMKPEEIAKIGGPDKITEKGHQYRYTLGPVQEVTPVGGNGVSKVWYIMVRSEELEKLRRSYGLSSLPNDGDFKYHITIGIRRKGVLGHNTISKAGQAGAEVVDADKKEEKPAKVLTIAVDLDGTLATYDGWKGEEHFGKLRDGAKDALEALKDKGHKIIVFTTRGDKELIKKWLDENELSYDHINENPDQPAGSSGKVIADVYIDDRAVNAKGNWKDIMVEVTKALEKTAGLPLAIPAAILTAMAIAKPRRTDDEALIDAELATQAALIDRIRATHPTDIEQLKPKRKRKPKLPPALFPVSALVG